MKNFITGKMRQILIKVPKSLNYQVYVISYLNPKDLKLLESLESLLDLKLLFWRPSTDEKQIKKKKATRKKGDLDKFDILS